MKDPPIRDRRVVILVVLITVVTVPLNAARCDKGRMTYERSQGYRLPDHILQGSDSYLLLEQTSHKDCYSICSADEQCFAYLLDHENNTCVLSKAEDSLVREQLISSYVWSYHRKLCIIGLQCNRQWSFDRIPGSHLIGYDDKTVAAIGSEDLCLKACATEQSFTCRSAQYNHATKYCVLSKYDRRTAAEAFRSSPEQVDYLENQCVQEPSQCHFHLQKDRTIIHSHAHVDQSATTRDQCKESCLQHGDFRCRSFVFDLSRKLCLLTPEDSYSIAESVVMPSDGRFEFYELSSCIEVKMRCESTTMTAIFKVSTPFRGKIYSVGHHLECFAATATDSGEITLTIPLHGTRCGTTNLGNGTFTNSVVLQHHPYILQNSDRRVDVACDYEEIRTRVRGGKKVTEGEFQSLTQVVTGLVPTPGVQLRVVNSTGAEVRGAELGEPLYLRVEMLDNSVFGISGSGLVARSGEGSDMIPLIDDYGCPIEPNVFPALRQETKTKSLVTPFQAFKFPSDTAVKFELTVSFCLETCPTVDCDNRTGNKESQTLGRKRRSAFEVDLSTFEVQAGDVVSDVKMESTLFIVSSPNTVAEAKKLSETTEENITSVLLSGKTICLSTTVVIWSAAVLGIIQIVLLVSCTFLVFIYRRQRRNRPCHCSSRASISSKTKLFTS